MILVCAVVVPAVAQQPAPEPSEEEAPPKDAAVEAILATKPTTPAECVRAAKILFELGRADLAREFLKKVIDAKLDRRQLAELGREVGPATFIEIAGREALQPKARQLADAVAAAIRAESEDAKRIDGLIRQLQDPSPEKRLQAVVGLQEAGDAAIAPLIAVLADADRAAEWPNVRAALVETGSSAVYPLMAVVGRADPKLTVQAIEVLGAAKDPQAVLCLLAPCLSDASDAAVRAAAAKALKRLAGGVPTRAEATGLLADAARAYFNRNQPVEGAFEGKVELWRWDESKRNCVAQSVSSADAARELAARWARDAHSLAPHDRQLRLLHLATTLEAAVLENGLDRPLDEKNPALVEAERFGVKTIEEVLESAMADGHTAAATAAARLLGRIGTADELLNQAAVRTEPAPLVAALRSPDRRLRLAAAEAIVRLQPVRQFAGSSYVTEALGFLAAGRGVRGALVASPKLEEARDLAGRLTAAGYQADAVLVGRELLLRAAQSPDCELVLIDVTIDRPTAEMLLQQLRHDPRTASLRVGLIAPSGRYEKAERIARSDPLAKAFPRPHDDRAFNWQLDQLDGLAPQRFVGLEARQRQAARALDLLADVARTSRKLYDLRRTEEAVIAALANSNPTIAAKATVVLAEANSAGAQRALVALAGRFARPLAIRRAAATAFRQNIQMHGLLLTTEEIQRQYDVYNQSRRRDAPTRRVLSLILDSIEASAPAPARREK